MKQKLGVLLALRVRDGAAVASCPQLLSPGVLWLRDARDIMVHGCVSAVSACARVGRRPHSRRRSGIGVRSRRKSNVARLPHGAESTMCLVLCHWLRIHHTLSLRTCAKVLGACCAGVTWWRGIRADSHSNVAGCTCTRVIPTPSDALLWDPNDDGDGATDHRSAPPSSPERGVSERARVTPLAVLDFIALHPVAFQLWHWRRPGRSTSRSPSASSRSPSQSSIKSALRRAHSGRSAEGMDNVSGRSPGKVVRFDESPGPSVVAVRAAALRTFSNLSMTSGDSEVGHGGGTAGDLVPSSYLLVRHSIVGSPQSPSRRTRPWRRCLVGLTRAAYNPSFRTEMCPFNCSKAAAVTRARSQERHAGQGQARPRQCIFAHELHECVPEAGLVQPVLQRMFAAGLPLSSLRSRRVLVLPKLRRRPGARPHTDGEGGGRGTSTNGHNDSSLERRGNGDSTRGSVNGGHRGDVVTLADAIAAATRARGGRTPSSWRHFMSKVGARLLCWACSSAALGVSSRSTHLNACPASHMRSTGVKSDGGGSTSSPGRHRRWLTCWECARSTGSPFGDVRRRTAAHVSPRHSHGRHCA